MQGFWYKLTTQGSVPFHEALLGQGLIWWIPPFIGAKTSKALVRWNIVFNTYLSVVINYGVLHCLQSNLEEKSLPSSLSSLLVCLSASPPLVFHSPVFPPCVCQSLSLPPSRVGTLLIAMWKPRPCKCAHTIHRLAKLGSSGVRWKAHIFRISAFQTSSLVWWWCNKFWKAPWALEVGNQTGKSHAPGNINIHWNVKSWAASRVTSLVFTGSRFSFIVSEMQRELKENVCYLLLVIVIITIILITIK